MEVKMLSKESDDIAKIEFSNIEGKDNETIVLFVQEIDGKIDVQGEYSESAFTEEHVQELSNIFFEGLVNNMKEIENEVNIEE